jgi:hypothetical protein
MMLIVLFCTLSVFFIKCTAAKGRSQVYLLKGVELKRRQRPGGHCLSHPKKTLLPGRSKAENIA